MATLAIKPTVSPSLLASPRRRNADQHILYSKRALRV